MKRYIKKIKLTSRRLFERYAWLMMKTMIVFIFLMLFTKFFVFDVGLVEGKSMEPNFIDNESFIVNKFIYFIHPPERYDVVQIVDKDNGKLILKRIIGLPGEIVTIKRGRVYIQRGMREEPVELPERYLPITAYTKTVGQTKPMRYLVGDSRYFTLGDNREQSIDSRMFSAVSRDRIAGKVMLGISF